MYELWHQPTLNVVDFYESAIVAERHLRRFVERCGASAIEEYFLMFEGGREVNDFSHAGPDMIEAVVRLANEERLRGNSA